MNTNERITLSKHEINLICDFFYETIGYRFTQKECRCVLQQETKSNIFSTKELLNVALKKIKLLKKLAQLCIRVKLIDESLRIIEEFIQSRTLLEIYVEDCSLCLILENSKKSPFKKIWFNDDNRENYLRSLELFYKEKFSKSNTTEGLWWHDGISEEIDSLIIDVPLFYKPRIEFLNACCRFFKNQGQFRLSFVGHIAFKYRNCKEFRYNKEIQIFTS